MKKEIFLQTFELTMKSKHQKETMEDENECFDEKSCSGEM